MSGREVTCRRGTKGQLRARFCTLRIGMADCATRRIGAIGNQHLPGDEVWLVREKRGSGESKYYLSNLPAKVTLQQLAATIKARWICEQAYQQMEKKVGPDHFEHRSWTGLHRHELVTIMAYALLQSRRLAASER